MPPSHLDHDSANQIAVLVEFTWGADVANVRRYARWTSDVNAGGHDWTALPALNADLGDQHGGTQDVAATIDIQKDAEPVSFMLGKKFVPVTCRILECDPNDPTPTLRKLWKGVVDDVISNFSNAADIVRLVVPGLKANLDTPISLVVVAECQSTFGDPRMCKKDLEPLKETATLAVVSGRLVTLTGLSAHVDFYWHRGWIEYDGFKIGIRHWESGMSFELWREPPEYWDGQAVVVVPGCIKTIAACVAWGNLENFSGGGIAMPDYHPQLETGDDETA